jgi:hypothetical protein
MLRNIATKTIATLSIVVVVGALSAQVSAQTNAQTIIVDGVTYQAVPQAAVPAPATYASPVNLPAARVYPVQAPVYSAAPVIEPQVTHSTVDVVAPLVFAAFGLWAVNEVFGGQRVYQHRPVRAPQHVPVQPRRHHYSH